MPRRVLLSLLVVSVMILTPVTALAQGSKPETEPYTSEDGLLNFSYPAGWFVYAPSGEGKISLAYPLVVFSPSEEPLERISVGEDMVEGDKVAAVMILPVGVFALAGLALPDDPTPGDYAAAVAQIYFGGLEEAPAKGAEEMAGPAGETKGETAEATEEAMMGGLTLGEPEAVELADTLSAGLITFLSRNFEGVALARHLTDDLIAVTIAAAYPGEFTGDLRQLALDVNATVEYTGTADAIMAAMVAAPETEVAPPDVDSATLDGNALIDERCTVCHTRDRIDQQDKNDIGWTATVDRMISYGAALDAAERQAVINYLVETH